MNENKQKEERPCETFYEGQEFSDENGNICKATFSQLHTLAQKWIQEHKETKGIQCVYDVKQEAGKIPVRVLNIYHE